MVDLNKKITVKVRYVVIININLQAIFNVFNFQFNVLMYV